MAEQLSTLPTRKTEADHRIANNLAMLAGLMLLHAADLAKRTAALTPVQVCALLQELSGQVETTIMVAQSSDPTNGSSTQRLPAMRRPIPMTLRTIRARSPWASFDVVVVMRSSPADRAGC